MDLMLKDKRVLVAGGSRGLGLACATAFAAEGANVAICGRNLKALAAAKKNLEQFGTQISIHECDLSKGQAGQFVQEAVAALGGVDVLVTNSGGPPAGKALDRKAAEYLDAFRSTAVFAIELVEASLAFLRESSSGHILMISSAAVKQPIDALALSNTSRAGLIGYARSLATQLGPENITVNSIAPGYHDTDRLREIAPDSSALLADVPLGRLGSPSDLGAVVAFLASPQAGYITGQTIVIDGGRARGLY